MMNYLIAPETGTAARRIERQLRTSIVALELSPGARLSEVEIATRYGVSRQPVREALIALSKAGLVTILPQRGTVVVKISADRMMQARFIREQIEVGVVRRLSELRLGPDRIAGIQSLLELQIAALDQEDVPAFRRADEQFHQALAAAAGLPLAWQCVSDLKTHFDRACGLVLNNRETIRPLVDHHQAILDAVAAHDADTAEAAMRHHLTDILRALPAVMAERADLFE